MTSKTPPDNPRPPPPPPSRLTYLLPIPSPPFPSFFFSYFLHPLHSYFCYFSVLASFIPPSLCHSTTLFPFLFAPLLSLPLCALFNLSFSFLRLFPLLSSLPFQCKIKWPSGLESRFGSNWPRRDGSNPVRKSTWIRKVE